MSKVLIVEDDIAMAASIQEWLEMERYTVELATTGGEALDLLEAFPKEYDLIILDWELQDFDGIEVLKKFRSSGGDSPVLMLTGKNAIEEKTLGLDAGADDYLTKPFHPKELSARLRALLRRPVQVITKPLQVRDIVLDPVLLRVTKSGTAITLQRLEFMVLEFFMRHTNEVFSNETLIRRIWDSDSDISQDAIYTIIRKLRKKVDTEGMPSLIRSVHGVGYRMEP